MTTRGKCTKLSEQFSDPKKKPAIILFTREPNELNPLSISEQCTLAINAKSHQIDKIN